MALLFADVVNKYNAEKQAKISDNELSNKVADFAHFLCSCWKDVRTNFLLI